MACDYEAASWNTSVDGCRPGAVVLGNAIVAISGGVLPRFSCYSDRAVKNSNAPSTHREGRALDIGANAGDTVTRALVDKICAVLVANAPTLGVQQIIWNKRIWRCNGSWQPYDCAAGCHEDHFHVELTRTMAENLSAAEVNRAFDAARDKDGGLGFSIGTPVGDLTSESGLTGVLADGTNAVIGAAGDVVDGAKAMGEFFLRLLKLDTWQRVGLVLGGAALIAGGAFILSKDLVTGTVAGAVAKGAA